LDAFRHRGQPGAQADTAVGLDRVEEELRLLPPATAASTQPRQGDSGSAERISALKIPYDFLDKVFIGHLHSDHFGDFGDLWIGGVIDNRIKPLRVWGPSGSKPEYGTKYALDHMQMDGRRRRTTSLCRSTRTSTRSTGRITSSS